MRHATNARAILELDLRRGYIGNMTAASGRVLGESLVPDPYGSIHGVHRFQRSIRTATLAIVAALVLALQAVQPTPAVAATTTVDVSPSTPITTGDHYDRNPTFLKAADGTHWLFFARSQASPCVRQDGCPVDNTTYTIYYMTMPANGTTWSEPMELGNRVGLSNDFYGRTIAATQDNAGRIWVFWTSGGNGGPLAYFVNVSGMANGSFEARQDLSDLLYFNAEALTTPDGRILVIYEETGNSPVVPGVYARTFTISDDPIPSLVAAGGPALIGAGLNVPKAIVDEGTFRVVMTDATMYPTVPVKLSSSTDGLTWTAPTTIATPAAGVSNWDPMIFKVGSTYSVFYAPDLGDGTQRIEWRQSATIEGLAGEGRTVTAASYGTTEWWDYWPEAGLLGTDPVLFYTSEKNGATSGSAHIMMTRLDWNPANDHVEAIQPGIDAVPAGGTVNVAAGTYAEGVTITKAVTLNGQGATTVLDGSSISVANGFTINTDNVTISGFKLTGFKSSGGRSIGNGIYAGAARTNVSISNVEASSNASSGIFFEQPATNVTIDDVVANANNVGCGGDRAGRGILFWNGAKQNISVTNSTANGNCLVGIDFSDGSVTGLTVTGNTVEGNGDAGISVLTPKGPGANLVASNTVTNNGRFGIEIKNPEGSGDDSGAGSVVVRHNDVKRTIEATRVEDYMGIGVFRRDPAAGVNPDQPSGVVVEENAVSGIRRKPSGSTGEGFGIVVEGTGMTVRNNTVADNDVGIQAQAGNTANQQGTPFFDRASAAAYSGVIELNDIAASNTIGLRNPGGATPLVNAERNWWGSPNGPVTTANPERLNVPGASVVGDVDFSPWLGDGTDTQPGTLGFQPNLTPLYAIPTRLAFVSPPTGGDEGAVLAPAFTVRAEDADGNLGINFTG